MGIGAVRLGLGLVLVGSVEVSVVVGRVERGLEMEVLVVVRAVVVGECGRGGGLCFVSGYDESVPIEVCLVVVSVLVKTDGMSRVVILVRW